MPSPGNDRHSERRTHAITNHDCHGGGATTGLGKRQIAEFIQDQEVEPAQQIRGAPLSIGAAFAGVEPDKPGLDIDRLAPCQQRARRRGGDRPIRPMTVRCQVASPARLVPHSRQQKRLGGWSALWDLPAIRCIRLRLFHDVPQLAEHVDRVRSIGSDPALLQIMDRQGIQMVPALAPASLHRDQTCFLQHPQMHHDRAAINIRQRLAQRAGRARSIHQQIQQLSPHTMAERLENQVEFFFG